MICKNIVFDKNRPDVFISTYIINNSSQYNNNIKRPAILICPGGGYTKISDRESEFVALAFASHGYHAFVLHYSILEHAIMPAPIIDVCKAMLLIRDNSDEWFIDENKITICGFSAGGHVASCLLTMWHESFLSDILKRPNADFKPNFGILCYPLIVLSKQMKSINTQLQADNIQTIIDHYKQKYKKLDYVDYDKLLFIKDGYVWLDSVFMSNLLLGKDNYTDLEQEQYCTNLKVTEHTPPVFIFTTLDDDVISVTDSVKFVDSMINCNNEVDFHLFSKGNHGLSLATAQTASSEDKINKDVAVWFDMALTWLGHNI